MFFWPTHLALCIVVYPEISKPALTNSKGGKNKANEQPKDKKRDPKEPETAKEGNPHS